MILRLFFTIAVVVMMTGCMGTTPKIKTEYVMVYPEELMGQFPSERLQPLKPLSEGADFRTMIETLLYNYEICARDRQRLDALLWYLRTTAEDIARKNANNE